MSDNQFKPILFVEDDLVVLTAYRNKLQQAGFHVETAADGVEAMKQLTFFTPDAVILDLMLPKVNGVDVMRFIRKTPRLQKVPVIVLSTNSILDGKSDAILESAQKRLIKDTCTPAAVIAAIHEVLQPPAGQSLDGSFTAINI